MKDISVPPGRQDRTGRTRARTIANGAFLLAVVVVAGLMAWVGYQIHCFRREREARTALEADPAMCVNVFSPSAKDAPYIDVSELWHGRIYVPVVHVAIGGALKDPRLDQEVWDQLRSFRCLENLEIAGCRVDPNIHADFSGFGHLRSLAIAETPLSKRDIRTLAGLPRLQEVAITGTQRADEWLEYIGQLRQLRLLQIRGYVSDQGICSLARLGTLESLFLESDRLTSKSVPFLARLKGLRSLTLSNTRFDDDGLRQLTSIRWLTQLQLTGTDLISDEGVHSLADLEGLSVLGLTGSRITSKSASSLARLRNLKALILSNTRMDDKGLRELMKLEGLDSLVLAGTPIANVGAELHFPRLEYLALGDTKLTDVGLRYISHLPRLRCLNIAGTHVTNASIDTLATMPSLMAVYAYNTGIDETSAEWLRLMKTLESRRDSEGIGE